MARATQGSVLIDLLSRAPGEGPVPEDPPARDDRQLPNYMSRNPHLTDAVTCVAPLIQSLRSRLGRTRGAKGAVELEARLGRIDADGGFHAGTTAERWNRILAETEANRTYDSAVDWTETQIYYYSVPGINGTVRTEVQFHDEDREPSSARVTHTCKRRMGNRTMRCVSMVGPSSLMPATVRESQDVRVALSFEENVPGDRLPQSVQPSRVAIRQRKRFLFGDTWALDLSLVWSGKTKTQAEESQRTTRPEYHVEWELVDPSGYTKGRDDAYVACSLLLKIANCIAKDRNGFRLQPLLPAAPH